MDSHVSSHLNEFFNENKEYSKWTVNKLPKSPDYVIQKVTFKVDQYSGLGHVIQRKQCKSAKNEPVKELPLSQKLVRKVLDTLKGQRVVARKDTDGFYYPGQVVKCTDPRHALVEFNDKQQKTIPTRLVIATGGAVACPPLMVGDYVLVRVINPGTDAECFVPGIVQVLPVRNEDQAKFYTVLMYNGQRATTMRTYLVKISKARFEFAIRYIAEVQNEDRERIEENVYATPRKTDDSKKKTGISVRIKAVDSGRKSRIQRRRSRSDSSSDSRPRSPTPPPSEQSNARSRSNSPPPPTPRGKTSKRSRSRSRSGSRSRSRSGSRSRSRSRSRSDSRSRSRSRSRSDSRSRSRSGSRSKSRSRSRSRSRSKSPSPRSKSPPHAKTESRSSSRDRSDRRKSGSRSASPEEKIETSRSEKEQKLYALKEKLQHQQEEQEKQQDLIRKQARKLKKFKKRMKKLKKKRSSSIDSQAKLQDEDSDSYNKEQERHKKSERQGSVSSSKAGPTGTPVTPSLLKIRKSLPPLREGEEVLARWSDEGWYFRGVVQQDCGDFSYYVEDATKMCEKIWREDIITDYDDANQVIQPKDPVVALHPHYSFSYSPGVVLEVYQNFFMKIRFYDGEEAKLPREEIYKLTAQKFEHDVNYIIECETRWVGQAIVARDDSTGTYRLASVKDRVGSGREYVVEWCDGDETVQHSINIFGTFTKHHPLAVGDHVLAMADEQQHIYLPGWVAGIVGNKINIKFCNGLIRDIEDILHCFWLSTDYYDNAVQFYKKFHPD